MDEVAGAGLGVQRFGELDAVPEQCVGSGRLVPLDDPVPTSRRAAVLRRAKVLPLPELESAARR